MTLALVTVAWILGLTTLVGAGHRRLTAKAAWTDWALAAGWAFVPAAMLLPAVWAPLTQAGTAALAVGAGARLFSLVSVEARRCAPWTYWIAAALGFWTLGMMLGFDLWSLRLPGLAHEFTGLLVALVTGPIMLALTNPEPPDELTGSPARPQLAGA